MRRRLLAIAVILGCAVLAGFSAVRRADAQAPGAPGRPPGMNPSFAPDSFAAERDSLLKLTLERIKGKEDAPAESVFRNIKVMKGRPARMVLNAMNAFGRSLGVSCRHCHVDNHWADEDKQPKQIAREMMIMTGAINDTLLPRVSFKPGERPHVGCFTCHRGHADPGFGSPQRPGGPGAPQRPEGERR